MRITSRELQEIQHALYYEQHLSHGTVGHNVLILLAKFARAKGFDLFPDNRLHIPDNVVVETRPV